MAIDGNRIFQAVMDGSKIRDERGIISIFGVYLDIFYVEYYNHISFEFTKILGEKREAETSILLLQAAQECAYATFQGIRNSREWEDIVEPMIDVKEDQIVGFAAVAMAFGWGYIKVKELIPDRKLILQVDGWYEASGYRELYGLSDIGKCYGIRGVAGAFMDLLYGEEYPDGCFTFLSEEPLCQAKGDPYCEFVAQRAKSEIY